MSSRFEKVSKTVLGIVSIVVALGVIGLVFGDYSATYVMGEQTATYGFNYIVDMIKTNVELMKQGGDDILLGIKQGLPFFILALVFVGVIIALLVDVIKMAVALAKFSKDGDSERVDYSALSITANGMGFAAAMFFMNYQAQIATDGQVALATTLGWGPLVALILSGVLGIYLLVSMTLSDKRSSAVGKVMKGIIFVSLFTFSMFGLGALFSTTVAGGEIVSSSYPVFLVIVESFIGSSGIVPESAFYIYALFVLVPIMVAAANVHKTVIAHVFGLQSSKYAKKDREYRPMPKALIALIVCAVIFIGSTVAFPIVYGKLGVNNISLAMSAYIAYALVGVALISLIVLMATNKKEEQPVKEPVVPVVNEVLTGEEEEEEPKEVKEEPKEEKKPSKEEVAVAATVVASVDESEKPEEKVEEEKPAEEKKEKPVTKEAKPSKDEVKPAPKKAEPEKKEPVKKAKPSKEEEKKEVNYRTYHLVKRDDGKWEVKYAGGQKAIKLFDTQKEALEYSKKMAENQGGTVLVHNSKGENKGRIQKKR